VWGGISKRAPIQNLQGRRFQEVVNMATKKKAKKAATKKKK